MSDFTDSLRNLADLYDAHPELPEPACWPMNVFVKSKEELAKVARSLGYCKKQVLDDWYSLNKTLGIEPDYKYCIEFNISRALACERVVIGTRTVEEQVPVAYETRTRKEEIVEWRCPDSLLATEAQK